MADVARTAAVSSERANGLTSGSGEVPGLPTECGVSNRTNTFYEGPAGDPSPGYREIDSFSELSFRTGDEVSLQDLIESEFAARILTVNGDGGKGREGRWSDNMDKSRDLFEDLFEEYGERRPVSNLDDFISGPMGGDASLITDYPDEPEPAAPTPKPVNIFKMNGPVEDMPINSDFDPFAVIDEDSGSSNGLCSPGDEFPVAPDVGEEDDDGDDGIPEPRRFIETNESDGVNKSADDVMRELFTKTVSDENSDYFGEQNRGSPGQMDVDEFYSSEDVVAGAEETAKAAAKRRTTATADDDDEELRRGERSLVDDGENEFEDFPCGSRGARNGLDCLFSRGPGDTFEEEEEEDGGEGKWTTVEEALKAQPENFELEGDGAVVVVEEGGEMKECRVRSGETNGVTELTGPRVNGHVDTESESESSDKKGVKKRKSKKGKKSDEKENISVDDADAVVAPGEGKSYRSSMVLEDLDDLSNVSVKNLMLTYSSEAPKSLQSRWYQRDNSSEPVPIQNLKARSMVDLTSNSKRVAALRSALFESSVETSRSATNLAALEPRCPVVTGVSVRALKERYCSMICLNVRSLAADEAQPRQRKKMKVPWSDALKSSFSKFDQLSKKTILHVRSVDAGKVQKQFNEASSASPDVASNCKSCGKQVFQMEQIKAEKSIWHRNCFRCKECNKQLSVDTYSSNEGILYCKPHFRELFKPKAVLDEDAEPAARVKKHELIIRENEPVELPPEVVRASDKPDLGLEELASLNLKSRYQLFEKGDEGSNGPLEKSPSNINVKRSPSILSKLAKFQKKGIDVGVRDEELNGLPIDQSSASDEEDEKDDESDASRKVIKSRKLKERPMSFSKMDDVKSAWENSLTKTREEMREERKAEIHQIRSKLFMGKQIKMKEAYEQAVRESENASPRKSIDVKCEKAKSIKECFEKGEIRNFDDDGPGEEKKKTVEDDMSLFEGGISKKSRSLFLELDKSAKTQATATPPRKPSPRSPTTPSRNREVTNQMAGDVVKSSDAIEDVPIETADISSKFKFFETYKEPEKEKKKFRITPPREGQVKEESPEKEIRRDPNIVRASDKMEQEIIRTNTTAKMLSLFRQMEEKTEEIPEGPKPLKRFTPPPDYKEESSGDSGEESEGSDEEEEPVEEETNPNLIRASDKVEDEYLKQAANAARAKQLRAKFEKWEEKEKEETCQQRKGMVNGNSNHVQVENSENVEVTSIECTKSLRARFESMKEDAEQPKEKVNRPKVNRFVEIQNNMAELCDVCRRRVYQLEKVETSGKIFHKACFRCMQCNCLLRMESFTLNCGHLYCLPHFKQKFISKGNYDEGFGVDQHKAKWPTVTSF